MVSPNSSAEEMSSGSMEENEKRFYSRPAPARQEVSETESDSDSDSDSENGSPRISSPPQKKPQPQPQPQPQSQPQPQPQSQPPPRNVANSPKPSSKRPREEEQKVEKPKKPKEAKKTPPLETPKQNEKKISEDKKKGKKPDSPPKSAKKNGQVWSPQDEIAFVKGVVAYQESKGLPKNNMTPVYEYIMKLNVLEHEYSKIQMYDKLRRMKGKFGGLKDKINAGDFKFKNPHDEVLYKIGKKLWGSGEEEEEESSDEEDEKNGGEAEEVDKKGKEIEGEEEEGEDEEEGIVKEGNLGSNGAQKQSKQSISKHNKKPSSVSDVLLNNGSGGVSGKLIDVLRKENLAIMNEFKDQLAREKEEIRNEIMVMVKEALRSSVSNGASDSVQFSSEEMIRRISSSREWPALEKAEAELLELKWHQQNLLELDASSKHLQLLQEECQLRMEKLRSQLKE